MREQGSCTEPRSHVNIMPTRMHDRHELPGLVLDRGCACVGKTRLFLNGQSVHIGANEHGRPRPITQHGDNAVSANVLGYFDAEGAKPCGEIRSYLFLMK